MFFINPASLEVSDAHLYSIGYLYRQVMKYIAKSLRINCYFKPFKRDSIGIWRQTDVF